MGDTRQARMARFLERAGWGDATVDPLAGDASKRRYLRLRRGESAGKSGGAVLMDAPPHPETRTASFAAMTRWLRGHGFSAPEPILCDLDDGFILLEDLGDDLYVHVAARRPQSELSLYSGAVDLLADLADIPAPSEIEAEGVVVPLRPYDGPELLREARLVPEWYLPGATGEPVSDGMAADFDGLVTAASERVAKAANRVVLRDYHAENLIWRPERRGTGRVGLLDYQDAMAGHAAYDLMSLLEDARRDTSEELQQRMIRHFLDRRPDLDEESFRADYAALAAIRNLKILGIFARLAMRDRKARYVELMPRVWTHLMRDLGHGEMAPLAAWVRTHVPAPEKPVRQRIAALAEQEETV